MTLKAAVIGVGSMGVNHARVYWELPDVDLVGVSDSNGEVAARVAKKYSTVGYTDYRKLLDETQPDIVTIAVPTMFHKDIALDVIDRGISLLIEKPIAFSVEEGQIIIDAAERKGVKLMIGHIERFNPAIIGLKQRITNGELGKIFQMDARREGPFPARIGDVGVIIDLAVHDLDIMRYVSQDDIVRVYAETEQRIHSKYEDMVTGLARFSKGAIGTLAINWLTPTKIREFIVTGEKGLFRVDLLTQDLYLYDNPDTQTSEWQTLQVLRGVREGKMTRFVLAKKEPLRAEQEAFIQSVAENKPVPITGLDGLRALTLAKALVESGTKKAVINL
ncbi:MAG TPA: Gfo/Idh/MocA family oxidoreductase [Bellilinea sp.]|nr:Gfo/Idh/MocA family oxidoreductase [Bellilinea sp.]